LPQQGERLLLQLRPARRLAHALQDVTEEDQGVSEWPVGPTLASVAHRVQGELTGTLHIATCQGRLRQDDQYQGEAPAIAHRPISLDRFPPDDLGLRILANQGAHEREAEQVHRAHVGRHSFSTGQAHLEPVSPFVQMLAEPEEIEQEAVDAQYRPAVAVPLRSRKDTADVVEVQVQPTQPFALTARCQLTPGTLRETHAICDAQLMHRR
jgi:hypothetical protein